MQMLSMRGGRPDGAGSRGGRMADDAEELEEGEACSDDDADELEEGEACSDDDAFFDPDVALSYIDEKLQHVLGHFQKEFEGGISAENIGPRFGGYGSFLPAYQHSPLLPESKSLHIAANIGKSRSPYQPSAQRVGQNPSTVAVGSISRNNGSEAPLTGYLQKKERFSSTNDEESVAGSDSVDSSFNGSDSKSLKVWTKVCSKNDLPRNKSAIYCGMGLHISSSSSMEESPDDLGGLSPEFSNVPYESPRTILQVMTCFPVPRGFLLSPLCGSLLQLTNKVTPMLKNCETHLGMDNKRRELEGSSQSPRPPGPVRGHVDKEMVLISRKKVSMDERKEIPTSVKHGHLHMLSTNGVCMSKIKNKRGVNQDGQETCKKTKMEDWHQIDRGRDHECVSDGAEVPDESEALPAKVKTMKRSPETFGISLHRDNVALGYNLMENLKIIDAMDVPFHCEKKEHPSDVDMLDLSCKKNVVKEWEENQNNSIHCVKNRSEKQNMKKRKSNTLKSEEMESKADSRPGKIQPADTVLSSSGGRLNYELGDCNMFVTGKGLSEQRETLPPQQALDLVESPGRDVASLKSSTALISSSYKISSSRRNKNSQQAKDFPVKSVSSSLLRNFNIKKLSHERKDGSVDSLLGNTHNLVRYQNSEGSALDNGQKIVDFVGHWAPGEPNFKGSLKGISGSNNKKIHQSACAQVSDIPNLDRILDNSLQKASWRKDIAVNDIGRVDPQLCSSDKKGLDMEGPSPQSGQFFFDRSSTTLNTESGPIAHENKNTEICQGSGTVQRLGMAFKKEKSHLRIKNQDIRNPVPRVVNLPKKESKQKVCPTSVKSDSLKMKAELVSSNVEKGLQHGIVKQAVSNPFDTSPMKKDGSMVAFAIKEARDLKHKANDLKNKGQELESTSLYFEAALKFMHVAFLLETPSFDSSRQGDVAQSMKMYSETAKLCNFCAYEYERFKKMAAAALAYKCVEVAYLKAAYYKHPSASKDRQELQAAVQIAPDVDNLNRHGLAKASSRKGGNSPQVPGSHLPLAVHNQARLLRLLAYTNDVNLAFDATRKSELAIACAAGNQERGEGVDDGLASVETVLDLNFSNVNELLRLVRVSMESISC